MTQSALTSTSPSSSRRISTPGVGGPTVPSLIRSGGLMVPSPQVSDMPQSSPIGIPIAWKNSSTSSGVGAALRQGRLQALLGRNPLFVGKAGHHRLEPGLELLEDPRDGEEPGRSHLRQEL